MKNMISSPRSGTTQTRAKTVKEPKRDVYTAKQGQAVSKMKSLKREIKLSI